MKQMKITLIIPPSPFLADQKRNPPLGIMYIASYLEANGFLVDMIDLRATHENEWLDLIPANEIYGITATTPEYPIVLKLAKLLKERNDCKIILGGLHGTVSKVDEIFDSVIIGEGELSIIKALKDYKNNELKKAYSSPLIKDLNALPFPAYHLLSEESFISKSICEKGERATAIMASRGCPFNCAFCSIESIWKRRTRYRTPENVVLEIEHIIDKHNVRQYRFQDDTLTVNKKWILKFCDMAPDIKWRGCTRVDFTEKEVLKKMFEAGCYELAFGIEDVSQSVLDINNKRVNVNDIYDAIKNAKDAGIKVRVLLMIGLPGQGHDVSKNIINFIKETNPEAVDLSSFIPMPGSDIYNNPEKYNIKLKKEFNLSDYVFSVGLFGDEMDKDFIFEHDKLTNEELKNYRKEILEFIQNKNMVYNK